MFAYQKILVVSCCLSVLPGCATITKDAVQPVKIETYSKENKAIEDVKCVAKNERGEWSANTPGTLSVHRSDVDLEVKCEKNGVETGRGTLISRANGSMFGNILFGGGIGAIIDHNKGTAYSYPDWVRIIMGDTLVYDRKTNKDNEVMIGRSSNPDELKKIAEEKAQAEKVAIEEAKKKQAN
ncbi:MAG TPA: hypothetical protein VGJ90_03905 [Methylophilaceae bacterium]|jgi:hypothetical protein